MSDTVKLIIEIPKEAKQAFDKAESNDLKGGYYDHGGVIGKAIQNGTPLEDLCIYHGIECDYDGQCTKCPHNTEEDTEWFKRHEAKAESEE